MKDGPQREVIDKSICTLYYDHSTTYVLDMSICVSVFLSLQSFSDNALVARLYLKGLPSELWSFGDARFFVYRPWVTDNNHNVLASAFVAFLYPSYGMHDEQRWKHTRIDKDTMIPKVLPDTHIQNGRSFLASLPCSIDPRIVPVLACPGPLLPFLPPFTSLLLKTKEERKEKNMSGPQPPCYLFFRPLL